MRHPLRLGSLVLAILLVGSVHVEAGPWDWIDELDGPGPSRGRGKPSNFMANIFCSGTERQPFRLPSPFRIDPLTKQRISETHSCLFFDFRRFGAPEDDRFYPVNFYIAEVGPSVRLHPAVELGAGFGWLRFNSRNPITNREFEGSRLTISFPRLVLKPLAVLPHARFQDNPGWGFLQMYYRATIISNELTHDDFASKPGTRFSRSHQRVQSMGFIIDVTSAYHLIREW
jgi:hypothetical protein